MGPLSARLLMERGRPKSDRLGRIRSLDLSGLKLLSEHLDPKLLSRLTQLQELDLSNNQLEMLPANLGLSHLRILRCANNQLGDVTALCQFPELEELSLEGNPFLTVSDNLKVSFLLPKLRKVNGKDASSTSSQVENLNRELTSRVTAHWEKFMASLSPEEAEKARADFVTSAVRDVRYGPESLSEFTQWRVRMISEELVASGRTQVHEAVVVLARLQWSPTELAYFSLSTCPDEGIVLCGDEEGNVWIYDVRHILAQQPPLPATPQAPTQILTWPQPRALSQTVTKTMVNTVVANPTFTYLTALTDSNIVAIWKRH
uniref:Leucine rich repeats and WD repeat domain containing 1 n=1 Tax=Molossus molossus TaxID=27622 RepID=A0A7J8J182_MOLMO|nr:leucine rich repeats and WD repeat domain containing 1 [Molossus molossus]